MIQNADEELEAELEAERQEKIKKLKKLVGFLISLFR